MPHNTAVLFLVVWLYIIISHPLSDDSQNILIHGITDTAVHTVDNVVRSSRIKSYLNIAVTVTAYRKLCLIAVMIRLIRCCHSDNRMHDIVSLAKSAKPLQIIGNLILFEPKLCLIAHLLKLAASALPCDRASCRYTVR